MTRLTGSFEWQACDYYWASISSPFEAQHSKWNPNLVDDDDYISHWIFVREKFPATPLKSRVSLCSQRNGQGNRKFRKEEEQDAHTLCAVRPPQFSPSEEPLLRLRLPCCPPQEIQLEWEGAAPKDDGNRADEVPEECAEEVQERLPGRYSSCSEEKGCCCCFLISFQSPLNSNSVLFSIWFLFCLSW